MAETDDRFDVIMVDSTDPIGPGAVLFTKQFYADCARSLKPGGLLVTQNGLPFLQAPELQQSVGFFRELFGDASAYLASTPSYFGGPMSYGWATDNKKLRRHRRKRIERRYREGRRLPDALLAARRPCRRLRAAHLYPRAGRGVTATSRSIFGRSPTSGRQ